MVRFSADFATILEVRKAIVHEDFITFLIEQNNKLSSDINLQQARRFRERFFVHI